MSDLQQRLGRRALLQNAALVAAGLAAGATFRGSIPSGRHAGAASPAVGDATATRAAELSELDDLRTQVAHPPVCTPGATETPLTTTATPTEVPLAQIGVPITYLDIWTITVLGIAPTPASNDQQPVGQFMHINLTVSHSARQSAAPPLTDFVLVDSNGHFSVVDIMVNQGLLGSEWGLSIAPGVAESRALIFDVAPDAGDSFILESDKDPTFRVALKIEQRG